MASVADILRKPKTAKKADDKPDADKDDKKATPKTNALLTFIADKKKIGKDKD